MGPKSLAHVLRLLPPITDPNVIIGCNTADDAAVYRINDELALVQTVDFFTPIVDDPYLFGQIAAANSLSDVYAMGATPLMALNVACFPEDTLGLEVLAAILRGGADKVIEAGINIVGGHTITDPEPKYGLVVTATVHPQKVVANSTARAGDYLVLTKPLGTGVITTAAKRGQAPAAVLQEAIEVMAKLNRDAAEVMQRVGVNACTDITGFGLLGHLSEMLQGSSLAAEIDTAAVPLLPGAEALARQGMFPGGARRNLEHLATHLIMKEGLDQVWPLLLADPQTSGGLLLAVPAERVSLLERQLQDRGIMASIIGRTGRGTIGQIQLR